MRFNFDLSAAPVLKPVDDGVYLLKVISVKEKKNDKENDAITYEFEILAPTPVLVDGAIVERIYLNYYISKDDPLKSLGFLRPLFEACGKLEQGREDFDTQDILGCTFGAEIVKRAGTPQYPDPQNRIRNYFTQDNCPEPAIKPVADE